MEQKKTLTKTYSENKKEVIDVKDLAGNITEVSVAVTTLNKEEKPGENNQNDQINGEEENWAGNLGAAIMDLPFAGKVTLAIFIVTAVIVSIILYFKYKKYDKYSRFFKK